MGRTEQTTRLKSSHLRPIRTSIESPIRFRMRRHLFRLSKQDRRQRQLTFLASNQSSDTLAAAERDVQITASESTVTIEEVDNPTSPDVVVEVGADRTVSFETPTTTLDVSVDNAASQHIDIIQFDESSIDLFVTSGGSDVLNVGTNDFVRAKEVSLSSGTVEVESELTATNGGLLLKADTSVIIQANLLSDNSLEIKDAIGVTINASANRVFQSTNSDILLNSVGTIELTGGSQLISMIAEQDVRLFGRATTGALVNAEQV